MPATSGSGSEEMAPPAVQEAATAYLFAMSQNWAHSPISKVSSYLCLTIQLGWACLKGL